MIIIKYITRCVQHLFISKYYIILRNKNKKCFPKTEKGSYLHLKYEIKI